MSCLTTHDAIRRGQLESEEVRAHLSECQACAELAAIRQPWVVAYAPAAEEPVQISALATAIHARAQEPQSWLSRQPHALRFVLTAGAALTLLVLTVTFSPRPDLAGMNHWEDWLGLAALIGLAAPCITLALQRVDRLPPPPSRTLGVWTAAIVLSLMVTGASGTVEAPSDSLLPKALACLAFGGAVGAAAFATWYAGERRSWLEPNTAILGAVGCALLGQATLQLHCPINDVSHLMLGHAALGPLAFAIGWGLAQRRAS